MGAASVPFLISVTPKNAACANAVHRHGWLRKRQMHLQRFSLYTQPTSLLFSSCVNSQCNLILIPFPLVSGQPMAPAQIISLLITKNNHHRRKPKPNKQPMTNQPTNQPASQPPTNVNHAQQQLESTCNVMPQAHSKEEDNCFIYFCLFSFSLFSSLNFSPVRINGLH